MNGKGLALGFGLVAFAVYVFPMAAQAKPTKHSEWTVMVYMNAKNNLECDGLDNFGQIARVGGSDDVHVVVEFGRPKNDTAEDGTRISKYRCGDKQPWDGVLRFDVSKGLAALPSTALANLGGADMGAATTLGDFVSWARTTYPANHYLLVIWNHGQGWRFETAQNQALKTSAARSRGEVAAALSDNLTADIVAEGRQRPVGGFKSVSFDDDTKHFLYNRDIEDSLGSLLKDQKLDVIGFDACLMSMVETGYAFRAVAKVMVGSEELEPGSGWDYGNLLGTVEANPEQINEKGMGQLLVDSYKQAYDDRLKTTMSAIDLSKIGSFADTLDALAKSLEANIPAEAPNIAKARASCENYGEAADMTNPIDIAEFASALVERTKNPAILAAARAVVESVGSSGVVYANYYSDRSGAGYGSKGVSIFFPETKVNFSADPDHDGYLLTNQDHVVEFVKQREWSRFLDRYLHLSEQNQR
jgi:hypothetical protein